MRVIAILIGLSFTSGLLAQTEEGEGKLSPFVEIPEISQEIDVKSNGIKVGAVAFQYIPEYKYKDGIIFGSRVRLFVDDIEGMTSFDGLSFVLKKTRIIRLADQDTLINESWSFADQGNGYRLGKGEALTYRLPITVGTPMYSGKYQWDLELADISSKKTVAISVKVPVISNPNIQTETRGPAKVTEAYFLLPNEGDIVTTNSIPVTTLEFRFDRISGFKMVQGKFNIGLALEIFNEEQKSIMKVDDATPNEMGIIDPLNNALSIGGTFKFVSKFSGKKVFLTAQVWDKNGSGAVVIGKTLVNIVGT